jgi:hypothetical protein
MATEKNSSYQSREKNHDFLRERSRKSSGLHRGRRATEGPPVGRARAGFAHVASPFVLLARSFGRRAGLAGKAGSARRLPQEVTHSISGFGITQSLFEMDFLIKTDNIVQTFGQHQSGRKQKIQQRREFPQRAGICSSAVACRPAAEDGLSWYPEERETP